MGWRFRKSVNLGGGLRLNLSKSGVGISMGTRGARIGIGPQGLRTAVGLPGTGIYWEKRTSLGKKAGRKAEEAVPPPSPTLRQIKIGFLRSFTLEPGERAFVDAINAVLRHDRDQAAARAREAARENPALADAHFVLALATGDDEERYHSLRAALEHRSQFGKYFERYRVFLAVNLNLTEELTLRITNDELGLLLLAAEVFQERGELSAARDLLTSSPYREEPVVRLALGEIYYEAGEYDRCIETLQPLENEDAVGTTALLYLGLAFREKGFYEAARDAFTRGLRRKKGRDLALLREVRYQRALTYEAMGERARARKDYERILAEDANYEDVQERLEKLQKH